MVSFIILVHHRFDQRLPLWGRAAYAVVERVARAFRMPGGCFLFCTRRAYEAVGGLSERYFAAEEAVFVRALKQHGPFVVVKPSSPLGRMPNLPTGRAGSLWSSSFRYRVTRESDLDSLKRLRRKGGDDLW